MIKIADPRHESQTRLPYAVFIVAQQRLTDAQRFRWLMPFSCRSRLSVLEKSVAMSLPPYLS